MPFIIPISIVYIDSKIMNITIETIVYFIYATV
jgi:hypothetical protein